MFRKIKLSARCVLVANLKRNIMKKIEVLIMSKDKETAEIIVSLINKNQQWNSTAVQSDEEAIEKFHSRDMDVVVFAKGIMKEEQIKLRKIFTHQQNGIIILEQEDNNAESLIDEIQQAIEKRTKEKKYSFAVKDDVFVSNSW